MASHDMSPTSSTDSDVTRVGSPVFKSTEDLEIAKPVVIAPENMILDGGKDAWLTVVGGFLIMFTNLGHANAFGVYESYYERVYLSHESSSTISWIGSVQISCLFVFGLITGPLFDAGKFRHIMIGSTILLTFCNLMLSFAKPNAFYQIFLSQGIGMGLAMGATYSPSYAICSHHFRRKRGFAMGLVASGGAVGGLIQPIMLNHLLNERGLSFGNAIRINMAMNAFLFIFANFLMKTKHAAVGGVKKSPVGGRGRMMMRFMTQPAYLSVTLGLIFNLFGLFFPVIYLQLLSTTKGLPENFSFYSISILNGVSAFGRILPNLLSDRFGAFNMFIPFTFATGLILLSILAVNSIAGVVSVAIFYGFFSGAYIALSSAVLASLADNDGEIGARIGLASAFSAISSVAGPPINGVLLGSSFNWTPPILFSGFAILASGICHSVGRWFVYKKAKAEALRDAEGLESVDMSVDKTRVGTPASGSFEESKKSTESDSESDTEKGSVHVQEVV